jgi:hypothetical protein
MAVAPLLVRFIVARAWLSVRGCVARMAAAFCCAFATKSCRCCGVIAGFAADAIVEIAASTTPATTSVALPFME